jgi:hypothetical protein
LVKEATALLELALWKAKLVEANDETKRDTHDEKAAKKPKMDVESARKELRVISGVDIIIKNVLPFLKLG